MRAERTFIYASVRLQLTAPNLRFGPCRYVDYVLDVPMYFVYRDGQYIDASGQSFRDFMEGRLPAFPGHRPSMADWEAHLTTVFPEVRLKRFLEMRGADNGPWRSICSLPALWVRHGASSAARPLAEAHVRRLRTRMRIPKVGLLYDEQALAESVALIADWTTEERAALRAQVPRAALATPFRGGTVQQVAQRVLAIAKARHAAFRLRISALVGDTAFLCDVAHRTSQGGLQRRGLNEAPFLRNLEVVADSGKTAADLLLEAYDTRWAKSVDPAFDEVVF